MISSEAELWKERPAFWRIFVSKIYACAVGLRNILYDLQLLPVHKLPGPTISIGNIVVGGTGKSPHVVSLCEYLVSNGHRPIILTRGYGSGLRANEYCVLLAGKIILTNGGSSMNLPDEARMQSEYLPSVPVIVGAKRYWAADQFLSGLSSGALGDLPRPYTHWVLDDGFQHRKIHRDRDVVLLNTGEPFGNGRLLPAGPLRESRSALSRTDAVIWTATDNIAKKASSVPEVSHLVNQVSNCTMGAPQLMVGHGDCPSLDSCLVLCGIARPERFLSGLKRLDVGIAARYVVGDHQRFRVAVLQEKLTGCSAIVTTAKDYWRQPEVFQGLRVSTFVVPLEVDKTLSWELILGDSCVSTSKVLMAT